MRAIIIDSYSSNHYHFKGRALYNFDTLQEEHLPNKYEREEDEIDLLDLVLCF